MWPIPCKASEDFNLQAAGITSIYSKPRTFQQARDKVLNLWRWWMNGKAACLPACLPALLNQKGVIHIKDRKVNESHCWPVAPLWEREKRKEGVGIIWFASHWATPVKTLASGTPFLWGEFQWEGGLWGEGKPPSSDWKCAPVSLPLSRQDPDVNRGPLMSKEVDKQAFMRLFSPGLSPANGLYSIKQLVCNFEDFEVFFVTGCLFISSFAAFFSWWFRIRA